MRGDVTGPFVAGVQSCTGRSESDTRSRGTFGRHALDAYHGLTQQYPRTQTGGEAGIFGFLNRSLVG